MSATTHRVASVDAFDLPDWVGEEPVTWNAVSSFGSSAHVTGYLTGTGESLGCDVLACDLAFPVPVLSEEWRHDAHQAWTHGQILLVDYDGRLTLVVPGSTVGAEPALEAVRRLAKSVGAPAERFTVAFRL